MDLSVIIATFNRAASLRRTLEGFTAQQAPAGLTWELMVVDNNSTDQTKQVCEEYARQAMVGAASPPRPGEANRGGDAAPTSGLLPLRYIFEPRQGKSAALNRAISETSARLLLFTDDDVDVEPGWLAAYCAAAIRHPHAAFLGGPVRPRWETPPPRWLLDHSLDLLDGVTVHVEKGATERVLTAADKPVFGSNMAIRRSAFAGGLRFREDIGPTNGALMRGEDTELIKQLVARGNAGVYVPDAVAHHRNPPERMTERYVRHWFMGQGMKLVRLAPTEFTGNHLWRGAPRHLWRKCLSAGAKYVVTRWTCPARVWLPAEIQMARTWGMIQEIRNPKSEAESARPAKQIRNKLESGKLE